MEQLFVRLLYEDWDDKKYTIKNQGSTGGSTARARCNDACKGKLAWFRDLEDFCRKLEAASISRDPIFLNRRQFIEGIVNGKAGVHDLREGNVTIYESNEEKTAAEPKVLLMDSESIERYIRENPNVSIQSKINMLNERLRTKIKDEFLGKEVSYTEAEMKAILKSYQGWYGGRTWKGSIFDLYQDFLNEQTAKGYLSGDAVGSDSATSFDVYDLAALAYLYKRVKEIDVIREAHHVVIDEAQDFGMMVYSVLKFCMKDCTYTIMGDVSQNIHFDYGLNDWEELKSLYLKDVYVSFGILKKSYRNTVEISNFATKILRHGTFSMYPVEPIIRHGDEPRIIQIADSPTVHNQGDDSRRYAHSCNAFWEKTVEICREWQEKGLNTIVNIILIVGLKYKSNKPHVLS